MGILTGLRRRARPGPRNGVAGVYRAANAPLVAEIVGPALAADWDVAWWALDEAAPELAAWTVGTGPGEKFPLLNEVLSRHPPIEGWLVVSDDDLVFESGDVTRLVAIADRAGFQLAQPAHVEGSKLSHPFELVRPGTTARRTTFVEIGPLFCVAPSLRDRVLPFPADSAMGWGLDVDWYELGVAGARLGIVDAVSIDHLTSAGATYDVEPHFERLRQRLAAVGAADLSEIQQTLDVWEDGTPAPPW